MVICFQTKTVSYILFLFTIYSTKSSDLSTKTINIYIQLFTKQRMMNYNERFLLYMINHHVIKPAVPTSSWLSKRNLILISLIFLLIKQSISCLFNDRYIDDWLGDYM